MLHQPSARALSLAKHSQTLPSAPSNTSHPPRIAAREFARRLLLIKRSFPLAVCLDAHSHNALNKSPNISRLSQVLADPDRIPFKPRSVNLVASSFSLHLSNHPPKTLSLIKRALAPDGLLLAAVPGPECLRELKYALHHAEIHLSKRSAPRFAPLPSIQPLGDALIRAGFSLPVLDQHTQTLHAPNIRQLIFAMRSLGLTNTLLQRPLSFAHPKLFSLAEHIIKQQFPSSKGLPVRIHTIHIAAWTPHPSQQKPLKPGSAQIPLAHALNPSKTTKPP